MDRDREFGEFVDARALVMRRTAYLLCGDWHRAEDIVQTALIKMYVAWSRVRKDSADAYARKVLVRTAIDEGRRGFFQRERSVDAVPEHPVTDDSADFDLRLALDALPPGQRAVVVLRYWEDLSVTETARILGRTEGTVKSQAAKGLASLRDLLEDEPKLRIHRSEVIRRGKTKLARRRTAIATAVAFVVLAGVGTAGYLALPRPTGTAGMSSADSGVNPAADRNAQLTELLRKNYQLPAGITAEDVPEINAKAFVFFTRTNTNTPDNLRRAVARLRDAQGVGGVAITIGPAPAGGLGTCEEDRYCWHEERNGIKLRTTQFPIPAKNPGDPERLRMTVSAIYPDGTVVSVHSDNMGAFDDGTWGDPGIAGSPQRPNIVLDREELIKIATLPGLTF
ncbi:RNA polymerase sigma-70 factor, sigma-E family [Lentzea waywayandensis]|uniref:RNA polymerase sigma-70 factor, sigma-E family n=1 Tax=Lentzea waywayandensis TaxID=84724 RepID=A0A1I6EL95_9PSEU|nr:SigE family RNA polymerase sigma factor [Lentzea waywayandensis]SFR18543.1 RNA polymerase sigma-70 factor, sigma-E family [Lentzea waywayandensis]